MATLWSAWQGCLDDRAFRQARAPVRRYLRSPVRDRRTSAAASAHRHARRRPGSWPPKAGRDGGAGPCRKSRRRSGCRPKPLATSPRNKCGRPAAMVSFEQQIAVAGALRERHQFARPVARQRSLAPDIGVEPQAPFGLEDGGSVSERFADLGGAAIGILRPPRSADPRATINAGPSFNRKSSWRRIRSAGFRQGLGQFETRREMRNRLLVSRPAQRAVASPHAVIAGEARPTRPRRNDRPAVPARSPSLRGSVLRARGQRAGAIPAGAPEANSHKRRRAPARA